MSLGLIPLLLIALILASTEGEVDTVEVVLQGEHVIADHRGALIVGDARVTIPDGEAVPGPVYVIGGEFIVEGRVDSDIVQLAGTVTVESGAGIGDELRLIGGTREIAPDAMIGRQTQLDVTSTDRSPLAGLISLGVTALLLATIGSLLERKRSRQVGNVAGAIRGHPITSATVGTLVFLTAMALIVFMAFTIVLVPVAFVGIVIGLLTLGYGTVAVGHLIGRRLPIRRNSVATGVGIALGMAVLRLVSPIPILGDLIVLAVVLTSLGAVIITYYGVAPFDPADLRRPHT